MKKSKSSDLQPTLFDFEDFITESANPPKSDPSPLHKPEDITPSKDSLPQNSETCRNPLDLPSDPLKTEAASKTDTNTDTNTSSKISDKPVHITINVPDTDQFESVLYIVNETQTSSIREAIELLEAAQSSSILIQHKEQTIKADFAWLMQLFKKSGIKLNQHLISQDDYDLLYNRGIQFLQRITYEFLNPEHSLWNQIHKTNTH